MSESKQWLKPKEIDEIISFLRAENVYVKKGGYNEPGQFNFGPSKSLAEWAKKLLLKKYKNIKVKLATNKNGDYFLDVEGKIL